MKLTFFYVAVNSDYYSDGKFKNKARQKCFENTKRIAKKLGIEVLVFDEFSDVVRECRVKWQKYYNFCKNSGSLSVFSDLVRITVLSKNPYYFYLDTDVWIDEKTLKLEYFDSFRGVPYGFWCLYNHDRTDIFQKILDNYPQVPDKEDDAVELWDYKIIPQLEIPVFAGWFELNDWGIYHLCLNDLPKRFSDDPEERTIIRRRQGPIFKDPIFVRKWNNKVYELSKREYIVLVTSIKEFNKIKENQKFKNQTIGNFFPKDIFKTFIKTKKYLKHRYAF